MKEFNGIEIAEYRLLTQSIFFSVFFVIGIGLAIFLLIVMKTIILRTKQRIIFMS